MSFQQLLDNANKFFNEKKYFRAHIMLNAAIKQCPSDDTITLSKIYTKLAETQFSMQKIDDSIQSATKAIQSNLSNSEAYFQRGLVYENAKNWRDALRDFQQASNLDPNNQLYKEKVEFTEKEIQQHAQNSENDDQDIPLFTEVYVKDLINEMATNNKRPSLIVATEIVKLAFDIFADLPNAVSIDNLPRITIVGDVHGQFHDVLEIFKLNGFPSNDNPYLFNGDFVDRGYEGMEIILSLFALKIASPNSIYLNRGNQYVFFSCNLLKMN